MDQLLEKEQAALARLRDLVVGMEARRYLEQGRQGPQPFATDGCGYARGLFRIQPELPPALRVGIFRYPSFPATVRFSSERLVGVGGGRK